MAPGSWSGSHPDHSPDMGGRKMGASRVRPAVISCAHCGSDFPNPVRQGPDRKFCSSRCKDSYWHEERARQRAAAPPRPCRKCGGPAAHKTGVPVCDACRVDDRSRSYKWDLHLRHRYGITAADYDRILAAQDGRCAICRSRTPKGRGRWHVDHDHVTGQVRGLLCNNCNRGIGYFGDDPEIIRAAARYVAGHRQLKLFHGKAG